MAVTYSDKCYKEELRGQTLYVGEVVSTHSSCERIMSDVWATCYYYTRWDIEKGEPVVACYGNSEFGSDTEVTVDAPDDLKKVYELHKAAEQAKRQAEKAAQYVREEREKAERDWHAPEKGKVMVVVRGRKVPQGTVGKVFWLDDIYNPYRAGLAVSDERDDQGRYSDVVWVNADYLKNVDDYPGYLAYLEHQRAEYEDAQARRAS